MSDDLSGQDAFDRLMEVALESRVDVRLAQDERDNARSAQREAERLAAERHLKIKELERAEQKSQPLLKELWEAAEAMRVAWVQRTVVDGMANPPDIRLSAALAASRDYCDQIPF